MTARVTARVTARGASDSVPGPSGVRVIFTVPELPFLLTTLKFALRRSFAFSRWVVPQ